MSRRAVFQPYRPKTILNKGKRADHWFWTRYSAYPYKGCQHGCEFCYCRERKYAPHDDPADFAYVIGVKENAPALLRKALARTPADLLFTGDYQPAERIFKLSRQMLEVCLDLGFPVFILSRSPLVLRDLDLLQAIQERAAAAVAFSIVSTPDSADYARVCQMERLAPPAARRFAAMEALAKAGILTGAMAMPILPGMGDDEANLDNIARWTAGNGGKFVLPVLLTLADQQRAWFMRVLAGRFPDLLERYEGLYPEGQSYGPAGKLSAQVAWKMHESCARHGIRDRMPRPIIPGDKRALNKRIVEALAWKLHLLELDGAPASRQWDYRRAAWAVEDLEQGAALFYQQMGRRGLEHLPGVTPALAAEIERLIQAAANPPPDAPPAGAPLL
jgi:DNA repair photolyase